MLRRPGTAAGEPRHAPGGRHGRRGSTGGRLLRLVTDLTDGLGVSRTRLSNHLACLRDCGLVVTVPDGRRTRCEPRWASRASPSRKDATPGRARAAGCAPGPERTDTGSCCGR
ncbi:ArsR family transcriptional regulator [Streptomyces sp. SID5914]|nr:ArsR family transcriptional regulator [Streptomyces sp. SID5914]